ncbi:MAG: hypothetical protein K6F94_10160, partial [Bacteroidaceae bacterium]|nr:hypothetical protein [Bacteroidaceae bacterium]
MRNFYLRQLFALVITTLPLGMLRAQTDVSELFMDNWGFDTDLNYEKTASGNVAQEILDIPGWTKGHSVDYTIVGTYAFGTSATFNTYGRIPAQGHDGSAGCLALSTGWEQQLLYTQDVTLPAGSYTLRSAWWNSSNQTAAKSLVGIKMATYGASKYSSLETFPLNQWTIDEQEFTLSKETKGQIQIGLQAVAGGSGNSAKVVLDYVKLMMDDTQALALIRLKLSEIIDAANSTYGDGSADGAADLKTAIDAAQAALISNSSTYAALNQQRKTLSAAIETFLNASVSEANPRDITDQYITNGDFENTTSGWSVSNMSQQSNSHFTKKHSTYYMETWVDRGKKIGDAYVEQILKGLPCGKYRLTATGLNIQQKTSGSVVNVNNTPQTGVALYAGQYETAINNINTYTVNFAVVDDEEDVPIGAYAENATGNWFCIDNFQLYYTGAVDANALAAYLRTQISAVNAYLNSGIQDSVRTVVETVMATAQQALDASSPSEAALRASIAEMKEAIASAAASNEYYVTIREALVYAHKVLGWWEGVQRKATAWANLQSAVHTAEEQAYNYTLTEEELNSALRILNNRVRALDKKIYESGNAVGTGSALYNENSQWCYQRSQQSKHWIVFWDNGYGDTKPSGLDNILETADKIFEFYADSLKFITINQGKSKTDTYKMIIRLRSSTEWEASGSGIDDVIGLLTLSRWAYTSRDGQTMAHEIGHCFQYQVHCDNNNSNGFMYANGDGSVFWEMCAQWQAYKFYPKMQFGNEWFSNTLNGMHREPCEADLRYNNYFLQDFWCFKQQDMGAVGEVWNRSVKPDDPLQGYMRIFMWGTATKKAAQLGDEMWEYGARMTTFDIDALRSLGANYISSRAQCKMHKISGNYWMPDADNCIENYGNNAIRLKITSQTKDVDIAASFLGMADTTGYCSYNKTAAGWRYGFVALKKDGTRVYSEMREANYKEPGGLLEFTVPAGCSDLFFVVSGAPTRYWSRPWTSNTSVKEQWPYKVGFYKTNLIGYANTIPSDIRPIIAAGNYEEDTEEWHGVYDLQGRRVADDISTLPKGVYIVNG